MRSQIQYAQSGDVSVAYQTVGSGPLDMVLVIGWVSHLDVLWESPLVARFLDRLGSFSRLILFDKRGTGLSDRVPLDRLPTLEERMDDVRAVMDAVGSESAVVFGYSEGGPLAALFAATYPERTSRLVIYGSYAVRTPQPDYPWAPHPAVRQRWIDNLEAEWGGMVDLKLMAPSLVGDEAFEKWWSKQLRAGVSPAGAIALARMNTAVDIRSILDTIQVPTLVMHRTGDQDADVAEGRYLANAIPNARFVELSGDDHLPYVGDVGALLNTVEEFVTGARRARETDRMLATVMFTDIVNSTAAAAKLGDEAWRALLDRHDDVVRSSLELFQGREVKHTGDGFMAAFDGPARGVRCAASICEAVRDLGLEVRAGLHTGECVVRGEDLGGIAVHIAARITALAGPGEVLASRTVKDLVSGSGISFVKWGTRQLKGVPGEWEIFTALP